MAKPFPYKRAAYTLAVGAYFSRKQACKVCDVPITTYDYWLQKKKSDPELEDLFVEEFKKLAQEWVGNATKTLNLTFLKTQELMEAINFTEIQFITPRDVNSWSGAIQALSSMSKAVGDLTIGGEVLHEEDIEEDAENEEERLRRKESDY